MELEIYLKSFPFPFESGDMVYGGGDHGDDCGDDYGGCYSNYGDCDNYSDYGDDCGDDYGDY
jgi:hypothetical protein